MSFLEAMAMGRCVIAPNNPTMNEYITHGENGLLYDLSSPKRLDLSQIRQIQENTQRYIEKGYQNWEKQKKQILSWLEKKPCIQKKRLQKWRSKTEPVQKTYYRVLGIPLLTKRVKCGKTVWKFLDLLPIYRIKRVDMTTRYYVLGLPLLKVKEIRK